MGWSEQSQQELFLQVHKQIFGLFCEKKLFYGLGSWLKVEQVIGKCGGTVVKTEMLRSSYDVAEAKNGKT